MGRTRILLADDHTMICAGLAKLLEPHYDVVGSVEDGRALLKAADAAQARRRGPGHWNALAEWPGRGASFEENERHTSS